jgi:integrase
MAKKSKRAKVTAINIAKLPVGRHAFGEGLYLVSRGPGAMSWVYRYAVKIDGVVKRRELGLGSAVDSSALTLAEARLEAKGLHFALKRHGVDPVQVKLDKRSVDDDEAAHRRTFGWCAEQYIKAQESSWKNSASLEQWTNSLQQYAAPIIGSKPVHEINDALVLRVLQPLWDSRKIETGMRVRGRIERILDWAARHGYRDRDAKNPARWRGNLDMDLGKKSKLRPVKRHAALPHREVAAFMIELRDQPGIAAKALQFAILTAARTGEVIGATWDEVDLDQALWTVPASRMKADKEHRVPLSAEAVAILREMQPLRQEEGNFVFVGQFDGWPLSNMAMLSLLRRMQKTGVTVHGFRSSFRDWCADHNQQRELAEAALAHTVGGVEGAYLRSDMIERRRILMQTWASYCTTPRPVGDNVVELRHG